jgi:RNA polymerase sigma-70 factor (ECF subfamily)
MGFEDPDRDLIERAQGELPYGTAAYNELVRKYSQTVYRRAYRILRSAPDAEEAVQEVFLAVFRGLGSYRLDKPFAHWLSTVTLNVCRMALRRRAREQRRRDAATTVPSEVGQSAPDPDLRRLVLELLDELDAATRIPLLMRFVEGYGYAEIARELELGESAVKMRVSRGAARLRELYEARIAASDPGDGGADDG